MWSIREGWGQWTSEAFGDNLYGIVGVVLREQKGVVLRERKGCGPKRKEEVWS